MTMFRVYTPEGSEIRHNVYLGPDGVVYEIKEKFGHTVITPWPGAYVVFQPSYGKPMLYEGKGS